MQLVLIRSMFILSIVSSYMQGRRNQEGKGGLEPPPATQQHPTGEDNQILIYSTVHSISEPTGI